MLQFVPIDSTEILFPSPPWPKGCLVQVGPFPHRCVLRFPDGAVELEAGNFGIAWVEHDHDGRRVWRHNVTPLRNVVMLDRVRADLAAVDSSGPLEGEDVVRGVSALARAAERPLCAEAEVPAVELKREFDA